MPRKGHSEEQIVFALKQAENGAKIPSICRKLGISDQTFYRWKHQYEGLGVSELRELRHGNQHWTMTTLTSKSAENLKSI